jgi:hypothetical protein
MQPLRQLTEIVTQDKHQDDKRLNLRAWIVKTSVTGMS